MSECKSLQTRYSFVAYEKPSKWYHKWFHIQYPMMSEYITINGDTVEEIRTKRLEIKNQLETRWGNKYEVKVFNA